MTSQRHFRPRTAVAVIIANMIGTGVFTTLGFQLMDVSSVFAIMMLWVIGGVAALCGALSYAELGTALPRSGGEYNFLSRIYHPSAGFISGWISATVGFAAPIAVVAIAFAKYGAAVLPFEVSGTAQTFIAAALVIVTAVVHARSRRMSGGFQFGFTLLKIALIIGFCLAAFTLTRDPQALTLLPQSGDGAVMRSAGYGVSLIYVSYAYTGWNAATYISGELERPQADLPRILILGTAVVAVLYVGLNLAFLYAAPMDALRGQVEIGYIAAERIFGRTGGMIAGAMLTLMLVSTVSAMTLAGPRALQAIGEDYGSFRALAKVNTDGVPATAIWVQTAIAVALILTASFETILVFAGSMLALNSLLTVAGLFVLRWRHPDLPRPFKTWGYPLTPLIYLAITVFTLVHVVRDRPIPAMMGLGLIGIGFVFWWAVQRLSDNGRLPRHD